jgi:hypothetical protein
MWRHKRGRKRQTGGAAAASSGAVVIGTEAKALENIQHNRRHFNYPAGVDFCNPIEHSLLYSMISAGATVYPEDVVLHHIQEEGFSEYLEVQNHGPDSYAQLSALLALSAEKFPPSQSGETASISSALCKKVLQCVVKYAQEHDLDRQAEVEEVLTPVERYVVAKTGKAEMKAILPFYLGYTVSILTANPIPMMIGFGMMAGNTQDITTERTNMSKISNESHRIADVETTGLLDEDDLE